MDKLSCITSQFNYYIICQEVVASFPLIYSLGSTLIMLVTDKTIMKELARKWAYLVYASFFIL
jgi:hypothetical protein